MGPVSMELMRRRKLTFSAHCYESIQIRLFLSLSSNSISRSSMNLHSNYRFTPFPIFIFAGILLSAFIVAHAQVPNHPQPSRITPEAWRSARQEVRNASLEAKIDYLLDRAEIEDIITTYAYSVDTRNWPLHGEIFKDTFQQRRGVG